MGEHLDSQQQFRATIEAGWIFLFVVFLEDFWCGFFCLFCFF